MKPVRVPYVDREFVSMRGGPGIRQKITLTPIKSVAQALTAYFSSFVSSSSVAMPTPCGTMA
jgi:hypothetical protein